MSTDWRLSENRREAFQRFYSFHLKYRSHPGCVYSLLPAIAEAYDLDDDGRAWLVWLNGNTQNAVTSLLLGEASDWSPANWRGAVDLWNDRFKDLEWDTDRRHQKGKFGEATETLMETWEGAYAWWISGDMGWPMTWTTASSQPYMGRLSSWSMIEYARILLGDAVPDADDFMLKDISGSASHRNGLAVVAGYDAAHWGKRTAAEVMGVDYINNIAEGLLGEAWERNLGKPWAGDVTRLTMESALCTYKSWHKPNRRYPNVYVDMMYNRIRKAEAKWGDRFQLLWDTRAAELPDHLLLERSPYDPGLVPAKQNHYLETGEVIMMEREYPDMQSSFCDAIENEEFGLCR